MTKFFNNVLDTFSKNVAKKGERLEIKQLYLEAMSTYELGCDENGNIEDAEIVESAFAIAAEVTRKEMEFKQKYG